MTADMNFLRRFPNEIIVCGKMTFTLVSFFNHTKFCSLPGSDTSTVFELFTLITCPGFEQYSSPEMDLS